MVLKDWKKISQTGQETVWDKPNKDRLSSEIPVERVIVADNPLAGWDCIIQSKNKESIENFEKKSSAIKYAMDYMGAN